MLCSEITPLYTRLTRRWLLSGIFCQDPGKVGNAVKVEASKTRYREGEKVTYKCLSGLKMKGSAVLECKPGKNTGRWSTTKPTCQGERIVNPSTFKSDQFQVYRLAASPEISHISYSMKKMTFHNLLASREMTMLPVLLPHLYILFKR